MSKTSVEKWKEAHKDQPYATCTMSDGLSDHDARLINEKVLDRLAKEAKVTILVQTRGLILTALERRFNLTTSLEHALVSSFRSDRNQEIKRLQQMMVVLTGSSSTILEGLKNPWDDPDD